MERKRRAPPVSALGGGALLGKTSLSSGYSCGGRPKEFMCIMPERTRSQNEFRTIADSEVIEAPRQAQPCVARQLMFGTQARLRCGKPPHSGESVPFEARSVFLTSEHSPMPLPATSQIPTVTIP